MREQNLSKRKHFTYPDGVDPNRDEQIRVSEEDVDAVYERFAKMKATGDASEDLDRDDVRYVAAYLSNPTSPEPHSWEEILAGDEIGYGVLKHEVREIEKLLEFGIDPLDDEQRTAKPDLVQRALAQGLLEEARYHRARAARSNRHATLGAFIRTNPAGDPTWDIGVAEDFLAPVDLGTDVLEASTSDIVTAANFFGIIRPEE